MSLGKRGRTVNVLRLVGGKVTSSEFTVRGLSGAVTAGKVVDDKGRELVARNVLEVVLDDGDTSTGVAKKRLVNLHIKQR
jgi:hypothetical protein